ncbi:MAG: hypothetical protein IVW54_22315 [Candidatus Binataceae bacterium]|nr:hypothetical protein [Candidatus Binataceae bacterium]
MWELIYWLITGVTLVWSLFTPSGRAAWGWFFNNIVGAAIKQASPLVAELAPSLQAVLQEYVNAFQKFGPAMRNTVGVPISNLAQTNFMQASENLILAGESTPANALAQASRAFGEAFGFGGASAAVTAAFEAVFPEKLNVLNGVGPALAKMAGFDEVADRVLAPLYENGFGRALKYYYQSQFKPEFASEKDAVEWHSRRLMSEEDLREVFKYSGLKAKYEPAFVEAAYVPVQARAIASSIADVTFPHNEMLSLLKFGGHRGKDIALLLHVFEQASLKNVRASYLAAAVTAAEKGTIDDPTLDSHLDSLSFSATAKNYVHLTVVLKRLEQLAELYRKSVTALYETNQLTDAQYVPSLQAIGIAQADAEAHYAIDSAKLHGRELLAAERATAKEQGAAMHAAIQTATVQYLSYQIDTDAMAVAIGASGLPTLLIPATIEHLTAMLAARRVDKFGRLVDRDEAVLLAEKVAALKEQAIKKLGTPDAWYATLLSYNIPHANAERLVAEWAAQAFKEMWPPAPPPPPPPGPPTGLHHP